MTQTHRIPTNVRALKVMEALANADGPLTPSQIGQHVGLPKQTAHRLCAALERSGYLVRNTDGRRFGPSLGMRTIASGLLHGVHVQIARHQILQRVAQETGETVNFVVPTSKGMFYRDRVETGWAFRVQLPIGTQVPFHATASGKVYLASLTGARRRALVDTLDLTPETPNSFTDPDALMHELARVAQQGYAIDNEELIEGMVAISVAINDPKGRYIASLAFHGPMPRLTPEKAATQLSTLRAAADKIALTLLAFEDESST